MTGKRVLIITSQSEGKIAWKERQRYVEGLCRSLEERLADTSVGYTTYDDLYYEVRSGQTVVVDMRNNSELRTVDLVHFKNWEYNAEEAAVVSEYLQAHGVAFLNSEVNKPLAYGKLAQMFLLARRNIPVPDTFFARKNLLSKLLKTGLPEGFAFPVVVKANHGSRGDNNHFVKDLQTAIDVLEASDADTEFVVQNFIANKGDYRFLFIGLDEEPLVFHRKARDGSHLNNMSKGGTGKFEPVAPEYVRLAKRAAAALGREIGGVDIIIDNDTGKPLVLEVNATPALAAGFGAETKMAYYARFLQHILAA